MKKLLLVAAVATLLSGCVSDAQRMAECESQGVSADACYQTLHNDRNAAQANAVAMSNAYRSSHIDQHAQTSHKHREALAKSGCTQVAEANGECSVKPMSISASVKQLTAEADHVMNKPISDSAEYLLSKGWKPNEGKWHKQGYILTLVVENEKVVNSQLTK